MEIPKKISPDRIKNAIVEIRYTSEKHPPEVMIGIIFQALDESYTYVNVPPNVGSAKVEGKERKATIFQLGLQSIFYNDVISVELRPGSLIFNCLNSYISWRRYLPEINKVLDQLQKADAISTYDRIGIRYISEYPDIDLQECVKYTFSFGLPEVKTKYYSFRSEFGLDDSNIILNLQKRPVQQLNSTKESGVSFASQIDIDVITNEFNSTPLDRDFITETLNRLHTTQKFIFFNLLKPDFLATLNPEY